MTPASVNWDVSRPTILARASLAARQIAVTQGPVHRPGVGGQIFYRDGPINQDHRDYEPQKRVKARSQKNRGRGAAGGSQKTDTGENQAGQPWSW